MIRIGVIGAGAKAAEHVQWFTRSGRAVVSAIADPDTARAEALASTCGARACARYESLLEDVDAVVVASPNRFHAEQTIRSARAGLHVYCEKPVGLSGAQAREMGQAASSAGVVSAVGFSVRQHPTIQTMHRLVREGYMGQLVSVWSRRMFQMDTQELTGWRANLSESGGVLLEINVHEIDWMMMIGGEVETVYARTSATVTQGPGANDHLWVTLGFAGNATGVHEGSWSSAMPAFFRGAHGTLGGAQTDEWGGHLMSARMSEDRTPMTLDPAMDVRQTFLDGVLEGKPVDCDLAWGAKVMAVADAILTSAQTGQVQRPATVKPQVHVAEQLPGVRRTLAEKVAAQ